MYEHQYYRDSSGPTTVIISMQYTRSDSKICVPLRVKGIYQEEHMVQKLTNILAHQA